METLTHKEEEIMQILWKIKKGFVKDIIEELPEPKPPYSTVSSVVRILEKKGFIGFDAYGKSHRYFFLIKKGDYRKYAFKSLLNGYFENSYKNILSYLVTDEPLDNKDLDELKELSELLKNKKIK